MNESNNVIFIFSLKKISSVSNLLIQPKGDLKIMLSNLYKSIVDI